MKLLIELKYRKEVHRRWKQRQATWEEYKDIAYTYRNVVRKSKIHLELELVRNVKGNKKSYSTLAAKGIFKRVWAHYSVKQGT